MAMCRLLPNLTPSRRGGVFSFFAEIGPAEGAYLNTMFNSINTSLK
jgi:hypothetical protein